MAPHLSQVVYAQMPSSSCSLSEARRQGAVAQSCLKLVAILVAQVRGQEDLK